MQNFSKDFLIVYILVAVGTISLIFGASHRYYLSQLKSAVQIEQIPPLLPDGVLIKALDDERVYYIENDKKRWIESKEVSRVQGFRSEDIRIIPANEINYYKDGEPITANSYIVLPQELDTLPDLVPLPIKDLLLKKLNGRTILKFTASFWNQGKRHFELFPSSKKEIRNGETYQEVYQSIASQNGLYRNRVVGNFSWHAPHKHYHYSDFANYVFTFIRPTSGSTATSSPKSIRPKTTFCIRDNEPLLPILPNAPEKAAFPTCGTDKQGLSVGWVDIYKNTLPDQYIDIHDMPAGIYSLSFFLDPNQRFVEERKDNNISTVFINLDLQKGTAKIIASAAPFTTTLNHFPDGMLIRAGGEGRVYVTYNNKKRPINNLEVFNSYGYLWNNVFVLTDNMIGAIRLNNLVRLKGTEEVYALNNLGYKRYIQNSDILYSYGFKPADIADINQVEFANYPESNLIRLFQKAEIYLITGPNKQKIGKLDTAQTLGYNINAIHTVNENEFNSYATGEQD